MNYQIYAWPFLVVASALLVKCLSLIRRLWWKPLQISAHFKSQGIYGPPYHLILGNILEIGSMISEQRSKPIPHLSHDIIPRILPFYTQWSKIYGNPFLYWFGSRPRLAVQDPEHVRLIMSNKFGDSIRLPTTRLFKGDFLGNGVATLDGKQWEQHRRIINQAFYMDNIKNMSPIVAATVIEAVESWEKKLISGKLEFDMAKEFKELTADIIARTAFGSSYAEGKHVFEMQTEQASLFVAQTLFSLDIPGLGLLPTKKNRRRWELQREVRRCLVKLIQDKQQAVAKSGESYGKDLLGLLLTANVTPELIKGGGQLSIDDIVDECKTFFFAGHDTTSQLLVWTALLLAQHQEWQEKARAEVLQICGDTKLPTYDMLSRLKILGMIFNEAMRLYPSIIYSRRETYKPITLGNISVPEHVELLVAIIAMQHDPAIWGEDAHQFNPQRFADGVAKACKDPLAFMPFGSGPRICVGQQFAMLEAKMAYALILKHFVLHVSPSYKHAPVTIPTLQPQYGMQIMLEKLEF